MAGLAQGYHHRRLLYPLDVALVVEEVTFLWPKSAIFVRANVMLVVYIRTTKLHLKIDDPSK
jgi:hypothetical protein